ncbi:MAG: hypothetical protein WA741_31530 [Candidatus Sulfotelmatobacter sp.]
MAQAGGLHRSTRQIRQVAFLSRIKQPRLALSFAVTGALSFWLPDLAIHIYAGARFDFPHVRVLTILASATFLLAYLGARRFAVKRDFKWLGAAMFFGVWLTGGLFVTLSATASGSGFAGPQGVLGSLLMIVSSLVPGVVYILAAYDGSFAALLAVTVGALLLWGVRASWVLLASGSSSAPKAGDNSQQH